MRPGLALALAAATLAVAPGCGDATPATVQADSAPSVSTLQSGGSARGVLLKVVSSRFGRVVADSKGEALYLFTKDRRGPSRCYGACAAAWPPVLTNGRPRAARGIAASRLGTARRRDGKLQVTYRGQPLYYYVHDEPGVILCQNVTEFGGDWLVVAPSGGAIR